MFTLLKNILLSSLALSNHDFIKKHNSENHSYVVGENQFINMTYNDEFIKMKKLLEEQQGVILVLD